MGWWKERTDRHQPEQVGARGGCNYLPVFHQGTEKWFQRDLCKQQIVRAALKLRLE